MYEYIVTWMARALKVAQRICVCKLLVIKSPINHKLFLAKRDNIHLTSAAVRFAYLNSIFFKYSFCL